MKKCWRILLGAALFVLLVQGFAGAAPADADTEEERGLTVLFTHDTHDHFLPTPDEAGGSYGGYTRLATLLRERREAAEHPVVTLDGGDFSMGSLFQTIYATHAPELQAMGAMGYDVATLGNHEFDYRAEGFADMLQAALDSGRALPKLVMANYLPPEEDTESWAAWQAYGIADYVILERGGLTVAVFGLMGEEADAYAPMSGMEFTPTEQAARRVLQEIDQQGGADYIICLSHSGTRDGRGEDYQLAQAVDGIDLIISAHTHTVTPQPIQVNGTLIVSCGANTQNLGEITLAKGENGTVWENFQLFPLTEAVPEDPELLNLAAEFQGIVEETYLSGYHMGFHQVLAQSPFSFTPISQLGERQEGDGLGNLIADSYVFAVKEAEGADYVPVDFAVVAQGVIRASLPQGDITVSDAFQVSSLGIGADGTPGYPLISVWLTGQELKDAFEVDASVTPLMPEAQLYGAGMEWRFNPYRMIFDKVTGSAQVLEDGTRVPIEDHKLYRVVTGLYSGQMLETVEEKSFGILSIQPKDASGLPVTDFENQIVHTPSGEEVKEWYALASYLQSLGQVPDRYAQGSGKTVAPSWNPIDLLAHPGWPTVAAVSAALAALLLLAGAVRAVYRWKKK